MRSVALVASLLLFAGCKDEPDFDTRYDTAAKEIEARARAMDADIAESEKAAPGLSEQSKPANAAPSSGE